MYCRRSYIKVALAVAVVLCPRFLAVAQGKPKTDVPIPPITAVAAGQETFRSYCASCHGLDARGDGPLRAVLKDAPSDLTQLSRRNGCKFPARMIQDVLNGNRLLPAHGSREMPIWSDAFRSTNRDESMVKIKISNLVLYIESFQQKCSSNLTSAHP